MSSKIDKKKHIFYLLNNKFYNLLEDRETKSSDQKEALQSIQGSVNDRRLIDKVYTFYKTIIQNINVGLLTIDLSGNITFANRLAAHLLGYNIEELLDKNVRVIFGEDKESQKILDMLFIPGKQLNEKEIIFRHRSGENILVGLNTSPIHDDKNNFDGVVLLFRDLTDIVHLRRQIEAAQILEESFDAEDFRYQLVERVIREVDKANQLLQEFFKFARPTKPKLRFHDIEMIIDGVYLLLAPKLKKRNIQFVANFSDDVPQVYVDETQLEQVILNIFLNAIDAMPGGGTLKVSTFRKILQLHEKEKERLKVEADVFNYVIVEISDTGTGIEPEKIDKIFNPFFTTKPDGVGLGLSICCRLIEENGGKINVTSQPGKGTTFLLGLPAFTHH